MTKITPPQIAGTWTITRTIAVRHPIKNGPIEYDLDPSGQVDVIIRQKGELVTVEYLSTTATRPELGTRLGVWQPEFVDGKVVGWELLLSDYDDESTAQIQIYKTSKCGRIVKLWYNATESGFDPENPLQYPFASRSIWVRN